MLKIEDLGLRRLSIAPQQVAPQPEMPRPGVISRVVESPTMPNFQMMTPREGMEVLGLDVDEEIRRMERETRYVGQEILRDVGVPREMHGETRGRKKRKLSPVEAWNS